MHGSDFSEEMKTIPFLLTCVICVLSEFLYFTREPTITFTIYWDAVLHGYFC